MNSSVQRLITFLRPQFLTIACSMAFLLLGAQSLYSQLTLTALSGTASATCGQLYTVNIESTSGFNNLASLQYSINWDATKTAYVNSSAAIIGSDAPFLGTTNTSGGELTYTWLDLTTSGQSVPDGTVILSITFRAVGTPGTINVNVTGTPVTMEAVDNMANLVPVTSPLNTVSIVTSPLTVTTTTTPVACFGTSTGTATVASVNGTGPYSYLWNTGNINGTNTGLAATTYTVTVTDVYGCTGTANATVTQPASAISFSSITTVNPNCQAGSTGSATATATGGTGTITYLWSNGTAGATASGLTAGTYLVTATDANGCTKVGTAVLTDPLAVNAVISTKTDVLCNGASTGSATVLATGGPGPYAYQWSANAASQTTATASGLAAGIYTVTVTGGPTSTCTAVATVQILQPTLLVAEIISSTNITCAGLTNGTATVNATGGTTPYTYAWPVSAGSQTTAQATNLAAGLYNVTVTDANNCTKTAAVIISSPGAIVATASTVTQVLCTGASTGKITVTVSGGTPGFTYLWSNGSADQTVTGVAGGTYTVTVTDNNGCTKTSSTTVTEPSTALSATISAQTNPSCQGNTTGSATVTATGGTGAYTYLWVDGQTGATASNLGAGTYIVTVTDANGCTAVASVVLEDPTGVSATITAQTNILCNGAATGSATVTATGGSGSYTYLWAPGGQTGATATGLTAGNYRVTVTATGGCTAVAFVVITQPTAVLAQIVATTNETCNTSNNGSATVNATGGTTPYSYLWPALASNQTVATATSLSAGTYTVTVTDANSCTATATAVITEPAVLTAAAAQATAVSCFSGSNGSATATPAGGTTPYIYVWSNGSADVTATGLSAATYTVTITDANGCTASASVTISGPASAVSATISGTNVNCFGGANGTAAVVAAGGTPGYTYLWNNGAATASITGLTAGVYEVTVTDSKGCTVAKQITITEPSQLTAGITAQTNVSCFGGTTGAATVTAGGGTPAYTYAWGAGAAPTSASNTGLAAGTYTVTVTDSKNCTVTATVTITQPTLLVAQIVNSTNVLCNGGSTGTATVNATGGTTNYTYAWGVGAAPTSANNTGLAAGTYTVTVTDAKSCTATASVTISQPAALTAAAAQTTAVSCFGGSNGSGTATPTGGSAPYLYAWSNGSADQTATGLSAATYTVTITDNNGCTATASVTISGPASAVSATISGTNINCFGGANGTAAVVASGGTPGYTYLWNNGAATASITGLTAGVYEVTVTDSKGCSTTKQITITEPPVLTAGITAQTNVSCFGGSTGAATVTVGGGTATYTYAWSGGAAPTSASNTGLAAGTYTVTVTDSKNCTATATVTITQPTLLVAQIVNSSNVLCNGGSTGTATVNATGGTTNYTYAWGAGAAPTSANNTGLAAGTYTVTVTDANSCIATASVTISQPAALTAAAAQTTAVSCFGGSNGSATATPTGGSAPYSYAWSNGSADQTATGLSAATYTVTITDNNGCTATASVTISGPASAVSATVSSASANCFGGSDGTATVVASGGTPGYTYLWNTGAVSAMITGAAGTYEVTVTDSKGCTIAKQVTIGQPDEILVTVVNIGNVACNGESNGTAQVLVTGGVVAVDYTYFWSSPDNTNPAITLSAGLNTVIVTDDRGCSSQLVSFIVGEPALLQAQIVNQTNVLCFGGSTGTATVNVTGGTTTSAFPYLYDWGMGVGAAPTSATNTGLAAGTYTVTVTDNNNCTATASVTISQPAAALTASAAQVTAVSCFGGSNGSATATPTGGTAGYTYLWSNGSADQTATGLSAATYTVTITDNNGCTATASVTISGPASAVSATISGTNVNCFGGANGTAAVVGAGGTPGYTYLWNNGAATASITGLTAGVYEVTVTDSKGCTTTKQITITEPSQLTAGITAQTNVSCFGGTNGAATVTAGGGTATYTYAWGAGAAPTAANNTGLAAGIYTVTVTDSKNCTVTATVTITQPTLLVAQIVNSSNVLCNGGSTGTATVNATGGTTNYTYAWGAGAAPTSANNTGLAAGTYTVTVTDANNCIATASVTITQPASLTAAAAQTTAVSCFGGSNGSATATPTGGTAPYLYAWSNGSADQTATGLSAATYTVTITDNNGCTATASVTISGPASAVSATISGTNVNCFGGANGTAAVVAAGGTPGYTYLWNNGAATASITGLTAGVYEVTVTDSKGCSTTQQITITEPPVLTAGITAQTNVSCFGGTNGAATVTAGGGTPTYTYAWSGGAAPTSANNTGLAAGTYTVTVTDSKNCTATTMVTITQPTLLVAQIVNSSNVLCNGGSTGTATVNATGGTTNYTYAWGAGAAPTSANNTGLAAGTYTVTVTDANNCIATASVTISQPAALTAAAAQTTAVSCFGGSNGSATATPTGGSAGYTYLWSNGSADQTATGLSAATYTVTITDNNGCTATASVTISGPASAVSATISGTNVNCFGGANGTAAVVAAGGTPGYTYLWNNGAATASITGLTAGVYEVTVTDSKGCSTTKQITITEPPVLTAGITSQTNVSCFGGTNGAATVTAGGGTATYTYAWGAGAAPTSASNTGLAAGTYTVTVTDSKNCTATATVTITQPTLLVAQIVNSSNVLCNGGSTGTATVNATGGTTNYTYAWGVGAAPTSANNTGLAAGTYTVTVTDANNCIATASVTISQPAVLTAAAAQTVLISCNGGSNGSATVTPAGGTAPYSYAWSNGSSDQTATGLSAATYTVTITDHNGCTATASVTIAPAPSAVTAAITLDVPVSCFGVADGELSVTPAGGTSPYTYLWNTGAVTASVTGLAAGVYEVTVTDANGCTGTDQYVLGQPTQIVANVVNVSNVLCAGGITGQADLLVSGGTGPYDIIWSNGEFGPSADSLPEGLIVAYIEDGMGCFIFAEVYIDEPDSLQAQIVNQTNILCKGSATGTATVNVTGGSVSGGNPYVYAWGAGAAPTSATNTGLAAGTYTVTVTDANGCKSTASVTITEPAIALSVAAVQTTAVSCFGGNNGSATATPSNGTAGYTYLWSNGSADQTATGLSAATYTVTVTDANGCTATTSVTISGPASAVSATISGTNVNCFGGANGTAAVVAAGGTPGYTYLWNNGAATASITGLTAGVYEVTVTDSKGCSTTQQITITEPSQLTAGISAQTNVSCFGGTNGAATVTAGGGTVTYTYAWGAGAAPTSASNTGLAAGIYTVTVTDSKNCTATATVTITQPTLLVAQIVNSSNVLCNGGSTGTATVNATGGTTNYTYAWGAGAAPTSANNTGLGAGTYTVTVTDANNCIATASVTITQPSALTAAAAQTTAVSCFGGSNGSATATPTGGAAPYSYAWSNGSADQTATGLSAATYTVTITDNNSCTATASVTISGPASAVSATISGTNVSCFGGSDGTAAVVAAGGTPGYTYLWNNGAATASITGLTAGVYEVTVTDSKGCTVAKQITITEPPVFAASITAQTNVSCNGGSNGAATVAVTGGTPAYSYNWPGTPTGDGTPSVTGLAAGTYTVTVTDSKNCTATATVTITQPDVLVATITNSTNVVCNGQANGTATVDVTGGVTPYTYSWTLGQTTPTATGFPAGTFTVTVTDLNGCTKTASVTITQPAALTAMAVTTANVSCFGGANGTATVTYAGGTAPYSILWSNGSTDVTATGLSAGLYLVSITDANGCLATSSTLVTQPLSAVNAVITASTNVSCFGGNNGSATVTASGGTPGYTYLWNNGQTGPTATGLIAGAYNVTVTDFNGCTKVATVVITEPTQLTASITAQTNVSCNGGNNGAATVTAGGGTPGYTYAWGAGAAPTSASNTGLTAGTYTVTVTDTKNCTATATVTITQPTALVADIVAFTNVSCNGTADGTATVNATGGVTPYTYLWDNGQVTVTASGLSAGVHTVTVTDANSCTKTATVTIGSGGALTLSDPSDLGPLCPGSAVAPILLTSTPNNPATVYTWTGGGAAGLSNGSSSGINPVIPGFTASTTEGVTTVTVVATLGNCSSTQTFTININDATNPVFVNCPANMTVNNDVDQCGAFVNWTPPTATDNCGTVTITQPIGPVPGSFITIASSPVNVRYRANDGNGNIVLCNFTITVVDAQLPAISCAGSGDIIDIFTNLGNCTHTVQNNALNASVSDNCPGVTMINSINGTSSLNGVVFTSGTTNVIWTATDAAGNVTTCQSRIRVSDDDAPTVAACPSNITQPADAGQCSAVVTYTTPTFNDNCDGTNLSGTLLAGFASGSTFPVGTTTVTYQYEDNAGNGPAVCSFTVTITETQVPVISCPPNLVLNNDVDQCGAVATWVAATATDNCGAPTITQTGGPAPGTTVNVGSPVTITYRATDLAGNTASCSFTISVEDNQAPNAVCQNITVNLSGAVNAGSVTVTAAQINGGSSDNCPGALTLAPASTTYTCANVGDNNITLTVTDVAGNTSTCVATVTVQDVTAPTFTCPSPITLSSCNNVVPDVVTGITNEADNCGIATTLQNPVAGTSFGNVNGGQTTITVTVTDTHGNTTTCNVNVTILDDTDPVITCPANITVGNDVDVCGANVTYSIPTATDDCPGVTIARTSGLASGALFPLGNSTVVYTATDAGSNTVSCSFTVTVNDVQTPTAVCKDITVNLSTAVNAGTVTVTNTQVNNGSTDNCTAAGSLVLTPANNTYTCANLGTNNYVLTVTDAAGNSATCVSTVLVKDVTAPVITTCAANTTVSTCEATVPNNVSQIVATDNCAVTSTSQNPAAGVIFGTANGNILTITYTVSDASGNTSTCTSTITIVDNIAPVFANCPANITVGNDVDKCGANVFYTAPTATDNCETVTVIQTAGLAPGALFPVGTTTQTYVATDGAGNTTTCTFTVTVMDMQTPTAVCKDITVNLSTTINGGTVTVTNTQVNNGSTDNCTAAGSLVLTPASATYTCANLGNNNYVLTVTDAAGNSATCVSTVLVKDVTAPVITTCAANTTVSTCEATVPNNVGQIVASDNCAVTSISQNPAAGVIFGTANGNILTITYTVSDASGNTSTCTSTITIVDNIAPVFANCPANITVGNDVDKCGANVFYTAPTATDNCETVTVIQTAGLAPGALFPVGVTTQTYRATDGAGNSTTCNFTVTVNDVQTPTAVCKDITVNLSTTINGGTVTVTNTQVNNGSTDNCTAAGSLVLTPASATYTCANLGNNNYVLTVTDAAGNSATCVSTVLVKDVTAPVITTCAANTTVSTCEATVPNNVNQIVASDNCAVTSISQNPAAGVIFGTSNGNILTITYTVSDASGNTSTCTSTITIVDNIAPVFANCPANITVGNDVDKCGANVFYTAPTATDNCETVTVIQTAGLAPGALFPVGVTTQTYRATDGAGNTTTCNFTVTVNDVQTPTAVCKDITVNLSTATGAGSVTVTAAQVNNGSTDNCTAAGSLVLTPASATYTCANLGNNNYVLTVTDAAGNSATCVSTVLVKDVTAPVITTCAANTTVSTCEATVPNNVGQIVASDNCAVSTVTQNPAPGVIFGTSNGNILTITYTVSDASGNTSTCTSTITIVDNIAPVFANCPANITVGNDVDKCGANVFYTAPTATDNCETVTVIQTAGLAPGALFPVGTTTQTYRATDGAGNSTTCNFTVTVNDVQTPTAVCKDITVNLSSTINGGTVTVTNTQVNNGSSDNCTAAGSLVLTPASVTYTCANVGNNNYVLTVTDAVGNSATCVSTVLVRDVTPPTFTCPAPITLASCDNTVPNVVSGINSQADNCGIATTLQNPVAGTSFGNVNGGQTTITVTVTDVNGNTSTCNVAITIVDNTPPVITCPASITVGNDVDKCGANVTYSIPTVTDDCPGVTLTRTSGLASGSLFPLGTSTVVYRATDTGGNTVTCSFTVTVNDVQTPTAVCKDITVNLSPAINAGSVTVTAAQVNGGSTDNCTAAASLVLTPASATYTCANVGNNSYTLTVTDAAGNSSTCVATVLVRDVTPPTFTCPAPQSVTGCDQLVPNVVAQVTNAADNCGVASITQNPVAGTDFGNASGQIVNVTITVTDVNGNVSTCIVPVQISDVIPPVFVNCPTTTVMIGNDPDQCSGKLNWSIPVATDNCNLQSIVQTGGPASGSVVSITCPPTAQTITYRATDASGNTSTCTFLVMVVDQQKPNFDADITMPTNITVECSAVPTNCVFHGNGICSPLTTDDVNDNCTAPQNLVITYNEVSTQGNNPNLCSFYGYTLTRTWTVTDCAGNSRQHTQVITVHDTTKPTAVCKNITITLDDFGTATINPKQLDGGSTDNCAANANLTFTASKTTFNCADLANSPVTVTLTVTDPCGNFSTCTALVTILQGNGDCTPQYDVEGSDPCVCLDNATTLENGQFSEFIQIHALAGQTWTLVSSTGLYQANSPVPPGAPIPFPAGTLLIVGNTDGVDNDGDNIIDELDERVYYTLKGRHVDAIGYTGVFSNGAGGDQFTLANKCYYPNPYFTNLNDPFCLYTPPFEIGVEEYNNAAGNVINQMVDGLPSTTFDASALGEGFHTVMATFDAGAAQPFIKLNGVTIVGSEQEAINDPGCKQKITKVVQVVGTPTVVACNDLVNVSLSEACTHTLMPDDVLEGTYYCYDDYIVELDKIAPYGNGPWVPAILTSADIGKTYGYRVVHILSGNSCWGSVHIDDKLPPVLACPANLTVHCNECVTTACTGIPGITDCDNTTTQFTEVIDDPGQCTGTQKVINRTWVVTDHSGNQSVCYQAITIIPFDFADVIYPSDITISCINISLGSASTNPVFTGRPSIAGFPIGNNGSCPTSVGYDDVVLNICPGDYEIIRKWFVRNSCLPLGPGNPQEHYQLVKVVDGVGPTMDCPANITVSTNPNQCCASADLPDLIVTEHCSSIISLKASVIGTDSLNGQIQIANLNGHLADFPGNNYWNPDTLGVFGVTNTCLTIGTYQVTYSAEDACNNISQCNFSVTVRDLVPPVVACDEWTQIALGLDGTAQINAVTYDDGSLDNCGPVFFKARRMDTNTCDPNTEFDNQVKFCCSDIGDTLTVILRVYDVDPGTGIVGLEDFEGHYNDCMVQTLVEDKIKPTCTAPGNVTVSCEAFDPSLWAYGQATATDNCCIDTLIHIAILNNFDSLCNRGTITRRWTAIDCGGNSSQCTQRIIVNYEQDYYVKFPADKLISTCDGTGNYGAPEFYGEDCELLATSFVDEIFTVVPDACFKIERTWTVINWCTFNPNIPCTYVPNPTPSNTSNAPANLPGVTVSAPGNTVTNWAPTVVKINSTDPQATNYSTFWSANANCYQYKQIIKIYDTQDPSVVTPTDSLFCDYSTNDGQFWNDSYWWDNSIQSHDLCEGDADIAITATDACSGALLNFRYLLFLDLDGNGSMETVINSVNPPGFNNIQFNNANNPNYGGGESRQFDFRPVTQNQKWGFGLQTDNAVGNNRTAHVRWFNQQGQNAVPQLPYGTHKIKWFVEDGCGNEYISEKTIVVKDCKKPTVVCINGLSVNMMNTTPPMIQLWASDFLQYASDNCTPADQLKIGIRRSGTGSGFPVNPDGTPQTGVQFTCADLGTQLVELWAIDKAGNADFCETYVLIQDNNGACGNGSSATVAGTLITELQEGVQDATVEMEGMSNGLPQFSTVFSNVSGDYAFSNALPFGSDYTVTPTMELDPLNGVNTWDLVLISRHILGLEPLNTPYKLISADANKSGTITTFDIVELRKLILGTYTELPNNSSWRFVDKTQVFNDPNNPFAETIRENVSVAQIQSSVWDDDFVGAKIGDVDNTAVPNQFVSAEDRTSGTLLFDMEDRQVTVGETFTVSLTADQAVKGYQFTLNLNGLTAIGIENGIATADNFGIFANAITTSWDAPATFSGKAQFTLRFKATKSGKLSEMLSVSSRITKAEAYTGVSKYDVALRFNGKGTSTISGLGFELYQNVPNPWVSKTQIGFHLPEATTATLTIYDVTGRTLYTTKGNFAKGYNYFSVDRKLVESVGNLYYKVETSTDSGVKQMIEMK